MNKSLKRSKLTEIIEKGLCTGCGTCAGLCPKSAIRMKKLDGIFLPEINTDICICCELCYRCCPGEQINFASLCNEIFGEIPDNFTLGIIQNISIGHSEDNALRYNASSGGLITRLLIFALEENLVDGVLVTRMNKANPLEPETIIATTSEEILSSMGSKYCPVPANARLKDLLAREGRYAVVGLPCHIHGIRKLESENKEVKAKIIYHFGIFCANCVTFNGTENFLKIKGIQPREVESIEYRSKGWPGKITVHLKNGEVAEFSKGASEKSFWKKIEYSSSFHFDFMPVRCLTCPDMTNILADISFGDPWLKELMKMETCGKSLVVSRNLKGDELIQKCIGKGLIAMTPIDLKTLSKAQNYSYKQRYSARIEVLKKLGMPVPRYDVVFKRPSWIGYFDVAFYLPSFVSHHRELWSMIRVYSVCRTCVKSVISLKTSVRKLFSR